MITVDIHVAKTRLLTLVDQAARGRPFIITEAGRPLVKVIAVDAPMPRETTRLGFLTGLFEVPEDFDRMDESEIAQLFGSER